MKINQQLKDTPKQQDEEAIKILRCRKSQVVDGIHVEIIKAAGIKPTCIFYTVKKNIMGDT